ncbi:precursor of CEP12 [Forsythia ovata]|uniref:Precursor of CEP12 n=1 Tax=Forsythia ovata TaxID=205694 RepID=A0ABD1RN67_9LAMI
MASRNRNYMLALYFVSLLLQQHFGLISASRMANIQPSAPIPSLNSPTHFDLISASGKPNIHPPAPVPRWSSPNLPGSRRVIINRYKKIQSDAFRPTTPGHSPGMGNNGPPGVHKL